MNKKGSNVNTEASVRAQFTCNEPEGSGAEFKTNVANGALVDLNSAAGAATGLSLKNFDTRGPLEKFEGINFYDSSGNIASAAVNCSNSILNKKPCFPEMVFDNLKSTSPIKALPIIDDIGQILGVLMNKKGSNVNLSLIHI